MLFWKLYNIICSRYIGIQRIIVFRNFKFKYLSICAYHRLFFHSRLKLLIQFLYFSFFNRNTNKLYRLKQLCNNFLFRIRIISNRYFYNSYQCIIISFLLLSNVLSVSIFSIIIAICKLSNLRLQLIVSFIYSCRVLIYRIDTYFLFLSTE